MSAEYRKFERFDLTLPAKIAVVSRKERDAQSLSLSTKNICEGGAWFNTSEPLRPGTEVRVHLTLPLDGMERLKEWRASVSAEGRVVRAAPDGMAVSFPKGIKLRPWGSPNSH